MKICIVAYKFGTEKEIGEHLGTYHYFIEITRCLVKAGHEVFVIAPWVSFTKKGSQNVDGVKVLRYYPKLWNNIKFFPLNRLICSWYIKKTKSMVLKFDRQEKPDVTFVWQARETGYAVAKIKHKLQSPFIFRQITPWHWHHKRSIVDIYGQRGWYQKLKSLGMQKTIDAVLEFLLHRKRLIKYAKTIYQQADRVVFVSNFFAQEIIKEQGLDPSKSEILPVTIETELFKPLNKKSELRQELSLRGDKIILFIGRLVFEEKGIGYLIESMPQVIQQVPNVNLVIIGAKNEEERMHALIKKLNLEQHVQPVGRKPFEDLIKYINAADIFTTPSVWPETFGQVTIEGMACGVPVVTSDAGASPEINIDGQTGYVVPAANSDALAQAFVKILKDDELQKRLGKHARQRVIDNYTFDVLIDKFINIVKNV